MESLAGWATPEVIWFVIGLILLLLEIALPGLIIFFFGAGAWVVSATCFVVHISLNTQLIIFLTSSILLLIILRSRLRPLFYGFQQSKENMSEDMEEYIGETATVTRELKAGIKGRVEFRGTGWDALADEDIFEGASVRIIGKENITLKVEKV